MPSHLRNYLTLLVTTGCASGLKPLSSVRGAEASAATDPCVGTAALVRPMPADSADTFVYHYKYIERGPALPTLIMLPGGPGDTSIKFAASQQTLDMLLPAAYNLILTDPRGAGCNLVANPPAGFFTTDQLAGDVLAIIEARHLTDYFLFGWSYGTELATVVAAKAEQAAVAPKAVILEGTVGRHFGDEFPIYAGFQREWERTKASLAPAVAAQFEQTPLPLGLTGSQWAGFINYSDMLAFPGQPALKVRLANIASTDQAVVAALKDDVIATSANFLGVAPELAVLYPEIVCSELSQSDNTDMTLIDGTMIGNQDPQFCQGRPLTRPFDSANYQIRSPIVYVQGDHDPATTIENARYHYDHQSLGDKYFITVPGGTHYAFGALSDCFSAFWGGIKTGGGTGLHEVLATCSDRPWMESKKQVSPPSAP